MGAIFHNDWEQVVGGELEKPYYKQMRSFLSNQYREHIIYPHMNDIYNALHYTPYKSVKAVILGQDPYHGPNQAHGLSFSVQPGIKPPPSLVNIYKELQDDLSYPMVKHGSLVSWAKQGVLLLNAVLTVQGGQPGSHQGIGWEQFTSRIVEALNEREAPIVFILWGKHAQDKAASIDRSRHCVIASAHPSPFAAHRGFFGSRPFSRANAFLRAAGMEEINWQLPADPNDA